MSLTTSLSTSLSAALCVGLNGSESAENVTPATITPAQVATITGKAAPDLMYRFNEASGATEVVFGTDNLTDVSSPTKEVASTVLGVSTTFTSEGSAQRIEAASSTVAQATTGTITIIHVYELTSAPTSTRQLFGKRGTYGYEVFLRNTGAISAVFDSTSGAPTVNSSFDHGFGNAEVILAKRSETDNEAALHTRLGSSTLAAPGGDMTDAKLFSVGRNRIGAGPVRHALTLIWLGSDGDGFDNTHRLALAQAFGYE